MRSECRAAVRYGQRTYGVEEAFKFKERAETPSGVCRAMRTRLSPFVESVPGSRLRSGQYFERGASEGAPELLEQVMVKIYLAGPDVFRRDAIEYGHGLKALCEKHGAVGLYPMDNEMPEGLGDLAMRIRDTNLDMIRDCDAIVANMHPFRGPSTDVGTAYEMGFGAALGKIIVGYANLSLAYPDRVQNLYSPVTGEDKDPGRYRDKDDNLVEYFGPARLIDNLMLARGTDAQCYFVEQAIKEAVRRVKKSKGQ